jgi:hypothetical protein
MAISAAADARSHCRIGFSILPDDTYFAFRRLFSRQPRFLRHCLRFRHATSPHAFLPYFASAIAFIAIISLLPLLPPPFRCQLIFFHAIFAADATLSSPFAIIFAISHYAAIFISLSAFR